MGFERLQDKLNAQQYAAVMHTEGPLLLFAGAGSGKTRVITYRTAHILEDLGVAPYRVMCVTFTNKAAGEMRARLQALVGADRAKQIWIATFHSTGVRLLRRFHDRAGLPASFAVYDDGDSRTAMNRVLKDLGVDDKQLDVRNALSRVDSFKQELLSPQDALDRATTQLERLAAHCYRAYEDSLRAANAVDFGDLLKRTVELLESDETVREGLRERFQYLMVDEFQDTNTAQYRLVRALLNNKRNLCVVGDDDQAIYGWRGADIRNILGFQKDLPDATVIKLEENYRSSAFILRAANAVISKVAGRADKTLYTQQRDGEPIHLLDTSSEREEAMAVAALVRKAIRTGTPPSEIAVFYRIHAQSRPLEEAMRALNIAYIVVGGARFYERAEIKDVLCYLRLMINTHDDVGLLRVINQPARGSGKTSLDRLLTHARERGQPLWKLIAVGDYPSDLGPAIRKRFADFYRLVNDLRRNVATSRPAELTLTVLERTGYTAMLAADRSPEGETRRQNVDELVGTMQAYEREVPEATVADFLDRVSLSEEGETEGTDPRSKSVSLMTVHGAKGLEFDMVFVTGLEEEMFPYKGTRMGERELLDEERRLAYVAFTRARKSLSLSFARARLIFGNTRVNLVSRFVREIPEEILAGYNTRAPSSDAPTLRMPAPASEAASNVRVVYDEPTSVAPSVYRKGTRVRHAQFGVGRIEQIEPQGDDVRLTIYFPAAGQKKIMASFVRPL